MEYGSGHKRSKRQRLLREGQALFPSAQLRPPPPESGRGSAAPRLDNTAAFISPADCMSGDTGHEPPSRRLYEPLPLPHRILGCPSASVRHGAKMSGPHRSWCRRPYLVRNFNTAVTSLQMDVSFPDYSKSPAEIQKEHCARQAKRRRLANGTFRGNGGIDLPPDSPGHLDRLLRVDIGMILHKKSARVKFSVQSDTPAQGASSRARCRVSIYHIDGGHPRLLHCDSQICNVASSDNPAGPERMARVSLPQPFTVAAEKILIERDGTMDFADTYQLAIEVETVGDANWPPLKLSMPADASDGPDLDDVAREWLFVTKIWDLYAQSQQPRLPLMLWNKKSRYFDRESNFVADVILEWASLSGRLAHTRPEKDALEDGVRPLPIAEVDPDEEDIRPAIGPLTNGINGHAATSGDTTPNGLVNGVNGIPGGDKDEDEAELAPARTLRAREKQPQYNLRFLIDQAHGRLRRSRSTQSDKEDRQSDEDRPAGEDGLTYNLPAEQLAVSGFVCCVCGAATQSMLQLRAHFMCHPTYSFTMEQPNARGGNVVNISYLRGTSWSLRPAVYQLGRTTRPLDLKKLVEGDDSWVTDRYGPDNGKVSGHQIPRVVMKPIKPKEPRKFYAPNTHQVLFDSLSKARLKPGDELRPAKADDHWLIRRHREVVQDYTDVSPSEQEYIIEWDAFIFMRTLSSEAYIGEAFIVFAKEKGPWLVKKPARIEEFGKHMAALIATGVMSDDVIKEALEYIDAARVKAAEDPAQDPDSTPALSPKQAMYRSVVGCVVCKLPVLGPSLLICSNKECKQRLYHDDCVSDAKIPPEAPDWYCNDCFRSGLGGASRGFRHR